MKKSLQKKKIKGKVKIHHRSKRPIKKSVRILLSLFPIGQEEDTGDNATCQ